MVGTGEVTASSNTAKQRFADISPNCASARFLPSDRRFRRAAEVCSPLPEVGGDAFDPSRTFVIDAAPFPKRIGFSVFLLQERVLYWLLANRIGGKPWH
jgi:hypothetical protein